VRIEHSGSPVAAGSVARTGGDGRGLGHALPRIFGAPPELSARVLEGPHNRPWPGAVANPPPVYRVARRRPASRYGGGTVRHTIEECPGKSMACDMLTERDPTCIPTSAVRCVACHPHIGGVRLRLKGRSRGTQEARTDARRYYVTSQGRSTFRLCSTLHFLTATDNLLRSLAL